jgi:O-antigen ligase
VLGVGPGNFREHYFEATGRPPGTENLLLVHNAYLDVATELGVLAGLLFLAYVVTVLLRAAGANRKRAGPPGFAAAVEGALVIGIISSFFLSEQYFAPLWLLGALATALWREDPATDPPPATP